MIQLQHPLSWPTDIWPRTPPDERRGDAPGWMQVRPVGKGMTRRSSRRVTFKEAVARLQAALISVGAEQCIVSTDNGRDDPGASLSFDLGGAYMVMACDAFLSVADNVVVIAVLVENLNPATRFVNVTSMVRSSV